MRSDGVTSDEYDSSFLLFSNVVFFSRANQISTNHVISSLESSVFFPKEKKKNSREEKNENITTLRNNNNNNNNNT